EPREVPLSDLTNYSCLRHPVLELSPTRWVLPFYDRTVVFDTETRQVTPFGDGRNHGMVPIVKTSRGTLISGAPVANATLPVSVPREIVRGLRSIDGGKTWQALHAFPTFGVAGYDLTVLAEDWIVLTSIVYGVGQDGEWAYALILSRDDGRTWETAHATTIYNPGRRIAGRGWPRTVQLDRDTLGTLFYDLDQTQPGGPGVFFVRTPIRSITRGTGQ
ncbi:MAG: exo-alpha-sialidase, partial [Deltaproteobacteria bacterium]